MIWLQVALFGFTTVCTYVEHVECTDWNTTQKGRCKDTE